MVGYGFHWTFFGNILDTGDVMENGYGHVGLHVRSHYNNVTPGASDTPDTSNRVQVYPVCHIDLQGF